MHLAFQRGGRAAINKVMKQQPAVFLKLLVLLVPRELEVTHSAGVRGMTDEAIERAIEAIEGMLARRDAGENAQVIEAIPAQDIPQVPAPQAEPAKPRRKRKRVADTEPSA